jgi:hypothetical protein
MNHPKVITTAVALVAIGSYALGLWDRPSFEYSESLLTPRREWLAIVATSHNRTVGPHAMRLLNGTKQAILQVVPQANDKLAQGARYYTESLLQNDEGKNTNKDNDDVLSELATGLFWNNIKTVSDPKWAMGWVIDGLSYRKLQGKLKALQSASDLPEHIRIIRIRKDGPVLKARIPWRHTLTPMLAPMLHWKRGMNEYEENHAQQQQAESHSPIAMEVYVTGTRYDRDYIDYIVLMGDNQRTTDDAWLHNDE